MFIQNFDTVFLQFDQNTREVFFPKDRFLSNKPISQVVPFFADSYKSISPAGVPLIADTEKNNIYLDLFELGKDYKTKNLNAELTDEKAEHKYNLNCVLDFDITKIRTKGSVCIVPSLLGVGIIYTDKQKRFFAPIKENLTLFAKSPQVGVFSLAEIGGYQLQDKKIKQISVKGVFDGYITIRTKDNKNNINEMPLSFLAQQKNVEDNEIFFDSLFIDPDNTIITICNNTANNNLIITFKY